MYLKIEYSNIIQENFIIKSIIMKKLLLLLLFVMSITFNSCSGSDNTAIKDGSGNVYTEISIGKQVWLKEDVKATKLANGKEINYVENWLSMGVSTPEYTKYESGFFYNLYSMSFNNICPNGYKIPKESDWNELISFYGGKDMGKEKVIELINKLNLSTGGVSGFNKGSAIYVYEASGLFKIVYFRTSDGGIGFNPSTGTNRIRCIKQ